MTFQRKLLIGVACLTLIILQACSPAPRRTLNQEEKLADLYWLYSQFNENYAPLQYKQTRNGFNYEDLKVQTLKASEATKTNEEFYALMLNFVAQFKDAHTSAQLIPSDLPQRADIGYLGFSGIRKGGSLLVKRLLPTIKVIDDYPIKVGDEITKLNGMPLVEIVKTDLVKYRDLGNEESNYTYHMNRIFNRISLSNGLPAVSSDATLTVIRGGKEREIVLPWIIKDLNTFTNEQQLAAMTSKKTAETLDAPVPEQVKEDLSIFDLVSMLSSGQVKMIPRIIKNLLPFTPGYTFWRSFAFVDNAPVWTSKMVRETLKEAQRDLNISRDFEETTTAALKKERNVPGNAIFVDPAKTYPVYINAEQVYDKGGKAIGRTKQVAYMFLDTFSPFGDDAVVVKEVKDTLNLLQSHGVKDLIIDLIDNGGGSLELGAKLAQIFSPVKIDQPQLQFKISETWLDNFQGTSVWGRSDTEKEIARRVYQGLKEDLAKGQKLSRPWATEYLMGQTLEGNSDLKEKFNIVLLVNEMCASMCDIFSAIMQDNKLATVVGARTMGAGGNVVAHPMAPNSHLIVNQTESLIVRKDGSYIENNGVKPDVEVEVNKYADQKYDAVRVQGVKVLTTVSDEN